MNFTWEPVSDREGERDEEPEREETEHGSQYSQRKMLEKLGGFADGLEGVTAKTQAGRILPKREA